MEENEGIPLEVLLNDVKACLRCLIMIYCQRAVFHFDELHALTACGFRFSPYMTGERHPLSVWNCDDVDIPQELVAECEKEWREHRDEVWYLKHLSERMTCANFWKMHEMLSRTTLKSPRVTVERLDSNNGFRMIVEDSYGDSGAQKYLAFAVRNKVYVYLHGEKPREVSRSDMDMVRVAHGDSWEEIKEKLNAPDPMTQSELIEAFASHPDIQDSLKEYPERVFWPKEMVCKHCGKRMVSLYYESPEWTWEEMCGRAGTLYICPYCKEDGFFDCEIMN